MISKNKFRWLATLYILTCLPIKVFAGGFSYHLEIDFGNIILNEALVSDEQTLEQEELPLKNESQEIIMPELEAEVSKQVGRDEIVSPQPETASSLEEEAKTDSDHQTKNEDFEKKEEIVDTSQKKVMYEEEKDFD